MKYKFIITLFLALFASSCAAKQPAQQAEEAPAPSPAETAYAKARSMIGSPYKYRGASPRGFDCSGLVRYSYLAAGIDLPHGTAALRQHSRLVSAGEMRRGDLLFFKQRGRRYSHVGIYGDDNKFIHAPSSGKKVREDSLLDAYWKKNFLEARRLNRPD